MKPMVTKYRSKSTEGQQQAARLLQAAVVAGADRVELAEDGLNFAGQEHACHQFIDLDDKGQSQRVEH
eukprot:CAMPEP_0172897862 /NCGR_PEP_ID=MMETSP1075-20121228/158476_1 /TAXON_ID=2916 /ORGANISM="Ceratium fusus, Strain PA161109" /LENGTH=67 /DNA_ID=CAMNT_0013753539 /DNA_START=59 /DNA_END=258 /DNA_ORIENTATION=+